eukprot:8254264-Pyramimonas_sp.AAC.1
MTTRYVPAASKRNDQLWGRTGFRWLQAPVVAKRGHLATRFPERGAADAAGALSAALQKREDAFHQSQKGMLDCEARGQPLTSPDAFHRSQKGVLDCEARGQVCERPPQTLTT